MFLQVQSFFRPTTSHVLTRISTHANGTQANGESTNAQFSADGRYVVFASSANNLVAGDTNTEWDVFRKDLATGAIIRVSTNAAGEQAVRGESYNSHLSADGRYVVFESSATNLVAGDTNIRTDIFRKDLLTGAITRISTAANGVEGENESDFAQISADGRYAAFTSEANNKSDIFLVDLHYHPHAAAIAEGRYVETALSVGAASSVSIAWGDGTSSTVAPAGGRAAFSHTYATASTKAAVVSLVEGALTWNVAHSVDLSAGTMVRNTALADTLSGGAGHDSLAGDAFANILLGDGGNDRLNAADGNDSLEGGSGNDVLSANSGNDRLIGGLGKDSLTGGSGRDVFVFGNRETGSSKSKADYILDFSRRQGDKIDLKAIDANTRKRGDQKFSFIGDEKNFSKAGEVRFEKTKGTTYVYLNTDSDKAAEAVIKLKGAIELQKSWFVL